MQAVDKVLEEKQYCVRLPVYEGPFDLLYHLIIKEELDIWDIPLGRVTEQYLEYIKTMQVLKVDLAGEFLVMAASLLQLKSRLLLPKPLPSLKEREEEALFFGSKEELVRSLLEYRRFKEIALKLKEREKEQKRIYLRSSSAPRVVVISRQATLYPYPVDSLKHALKKIKERNLARNRGIEVNLPKEVSFLDKIKKIMVMIRKFASTAFSLDDFLEKKKDRSEIITTFVALLELARRGHISLQQEGIFGRIRIWKVFRKKDREEEQGAGD